MKAIDLAMNKIFNEIPKEILEMAFRPSQFFGIEDHRSLEEIIRTDVIRSQVLIDCNLVGGQEITIPFSGINPKVSKNGFIVRIPSQSRQGRDIVSVLSLLSYVPEGNINMNRFNTYDSEQLGSIEVKMGAMLEENSVNNPTATSNAHLIENNVVFVSGGFFHQNMGIQCVVANDANLANISPRNYLDFAKLTVLACKATIHNRLRIKINTDSLRPGEANGTLRGIIDDYSDSAQMYSEFLEQTWRKIAIMNDPTTRQTFIGMGII